MLITDHCESYGIRLRLFVEMDTRLLDLGIGS